MTILLLVLMMLATYRVTRLVVADVITEPARHRLAVWAYGRRATSWIGDLVQCHWCSSVWVAAGVVAVTNLFTDVSYPLLVWAACASVAGWLCQIDEILVGLGNRLDSEE